MDPNTDEKMKNKDIKIFVEGKKLEGATGEGREKQIPNVTVFVQ